MLLIRTAVLVALAFGTSHGRIAQHDAGNPDPYLDVHCPRTQPTAGAVCQGHATCSYGAGMCGPQCDCVQGHWACSFHCQ